MDPPTKLSIPWQPPSIGIIAGLLRRLLRDSQELRRLRARTVPARTPKRIGVAAGHGGFESKEYLVGMLREAHYEVVDFGDSQLNPNDDYPDFVVPLARAVANGEVDRGVAICGSGVGACVAANKVPGVRGA